MANRYFFSHPDFTVGFGISPNQPWQLHIPMYTLCCDGSRTIPPVGNCTLPRRIFYIIYRDKYTTYILKNQVFSGSPGIFLLGEHVLIQKILYIFTPSPTEHINYYELYYSKTEPPTYNAAEQRDIWISPVCLNASYCFLEKSSDLLIFNNTNIMQIPINICPIPAIPEIDASIPLLNSVPHTCVRPLIRKPRPAMFKPI